MPTPMDPAEVASYLAGDRLECLVCGKSFAALGHHVAHAHGISAREYKMRFGLPVSRGLCAPGVRQKFARAVSETRAQGKLRDADQRLAAGAAEAAARAAAAPVTPLRLLRASQNALASHGYQAKPGPDDFEAIIAHIRAGATIHRACRQAGLPGRTWLHEYLSADPAAQAAFDSLWDELPFPLQARSRKLGPRFVGEVRRLRAAGHTWADIGKALSVGAETCRRAGTKRGRK